jgi:uncharacterized membrane protein
VRAPEQQQEQQRQQHEQPGQQRESVRGLIRRWFFAGLLVWVPVGCTLFVIRFIISLLDVTQLLPESVRSGIPAILGAIAGLAIVIGTGALAANYLGNQALRWAESLLQHIPLVRSLYGSTKKLAENLFSESSSSFRHVVLIEWPHKGMWSIGFQAGEAVAEVREKTGRDIIPVFVPTTPNPTAGFIMSVPREDVIFLDMSIEEGMRYIISLGVVAPGAARPATTSAGIDSP